MSFCILLGGFRGDERRGKGRGWEGGYHIKWMDGPGKTKSIHTRKRRESASATIETVATKRETAPTTTLGAMQWGGERRDQACEGGVETRHDGPPVPLPTLK